MQRRSLVKFLSGGAVTTTGVALVGGCQAKKTQSTANK
ncbi:MAG: hypothetical protein RLZZ74_863, partial [Cyanobacteriota bacterium]